MTDFEYILQQARLFHYKGWEDSELRKCLDMLPSLTRQELVALYRSKWISTVGEVSDTERTLWRLERQ